MRRLLVAVLAVLSVSLVGFQPASADTYPPCTITGSSASETLTGTSGPDVICTGGGNDTVNALDGNDIVIATDSGDLTVDAGGGNDTVDGSKASDLTVTAGTGDDTVYGSPGDDTITGGDGSDTVTGGAGADSIDGGLGEDNLSGDAGNDSIIGGIGADVISGGDGNDTVNAGYGNDTVTGGLGDDSLFGEVGNDNLTGDSGSDTLNGGAGDDTISGGEGNDQITGEADIDTITGGDGDDTINAGDGSDDVDAGNGDDTITGGDGNDDINGDAGNDTITGDTGDDTINGGDGSDTLNGTLGDDTLIGGAADDTINGGEGNDNLQGNAGNDVLFGQAGSDVLAGNPGNDKLSGGDGSDVVNGGDGYNLCLRGDEISSSNCNSFVTASFSEVSIVSGFLRTFDGNPVVGAAVAICDPNSCFTVVTSTTGYFVGGVKPGTSYSILASGDRGTYAISYNDSPLPLSWMVSWKSFVVTSDLDLDLRLPATKLISLNFVDSTGAPILNATLRPNSSRFGGGCGSWCPNDPNYSSVQWQGIPDADSEGNVLIKTFGISDNGVVDVSGFNKDGIQVSKRVTLTNDESQTITFDAVARVSGFLRTFDGNPVVGAAVAICDPNSCFTVVTSTTGYFVGGVKPGTSYSILASGDRGTYAISYNDSPLPLSWMVSWKSFVVTSDLDLDLRLPATKLISLNFVDSTGAPILNATLRPNSSRFGGGCGSWCPNDPNYSSVQWQGIPDADSEGNVLIKTFGISDNGVVDVSGFNKDGIQVSKRVDLASLDLRIPTVPAKPRNLVFTSPLTSSISLTFSEPSSNGGSAIGKYLVEISRDGSTWLKFLDNCAQNLGCTQIGLSPGTTYLVRVAAVNAVGQSEWLLGSVTTLATTATAPKNLVSNNVTGTGLSLGWGLPESNGGSGITDYRVEVTSNGSSDWTVIPHAAFNSLGFSVTNLQPGRTYQFRVAAVTSVGVGAYSNTITVTTPGAVGPVAPASLVVSNVKTATASLSWSGVIATQKVSNYVVDVSSDGSTWVPVSKRVSTSTSLALSGLKLGTSYQVRVAAVNSVGVGAYVYGSFTTLATVSSSPTGLVSSNLSSSGFTLTWNAPSSTGGAAIADYVVEVNGGGYSWLNVSPEVSSSNTVIVTGLNPAIKYSVRVKAVNAVGVSKASSTLTVTTLATTPGTVTNLSVKSATLASTVLSWTSPASGGSRIVDYKVEYSLDQGQTWLTVAKNASSSTTVTLKGLKSKTSYLFRVSAKNSVGFGGVSQSITVTTP